MKCNIKPTDN